MQPRQALGIRGHGHAMEPHCSSVQVSGVTGNVNFIRESQFPILPKFNSETFCFRYLTDHTGRHESSTCSGHWRTLPELAKKPGKYPPGGQGTTLVTGRLVR